MPTHKQETFLAVSKAALDALGTDEFPPGITVVPAASNEAILVCTVKGGALKYKAFYRYNALRAIEGYIKFWMTHGELMVEDFFDVVERKPGTLTPEQKRSVFMIKENQMTSRLFSRGGLPRQTFRFQHGNFCYELNRAGPPVDKSLIVDCTK